MKSGECPKCGSSDVVRIPGQTGSHGSGNNIPVGWTIFSSVLVTRFLCADCGFSEEWVEDRADRQAIKDKYGD